MTKKAGIRQHAVLTSYCGPLNVVKVKYYVEKLNAASSIYLNASYVPRAWILRVIRMSLIANEQPREDARLLGGSIIKPCMKVPGQNESRSDVI